MLEIIKTADGSNTIYNAVVGENYHSRHGALQESRHVFLKSGLQYFLDRNFPDKPFKVFPTVEDLEGSADKSHNQLSPERKILESDRNISILEIGFGTGLNFLLSADFCSIHEIHLDYTGIEAYPLTEEMIRSTGYNDYVSPNLWNSFIQHYHDASHRVEMSACCHLQIDHCELLHFQSEKKYDVIYFDAFASARQPEMWSEDAISHTLAFLKPGGVFVTYAITGNLKRTLKSLGCKAEKAPGAPGKREMLRAVKQL